MLIAGISIAFIRCGNECPDVKVSADVATRINMDQAREYFTNFCNNPELLFGSNVPQQVMRNLCDSVNSDPVFNYFGRYPNNQMCILSIGVNGNDTVVYSSPPMTDNTSGKEISNASPVCPQYCILRPPCPPYCSLDSGKAKPPCPPYCDTTGFMAKRPPCPPYCDTTGSSKYIIINRPPCPPYCDTVKWSKIQTEIKAMVDEYLKQPSGKNK